MVSRDDSLFQFQGDAVNLPEEENTPQKRVEKIFQRMDKVVIFGVTFFIQISHCKKNLIGVFLVIKTSLFRDFLQLSQ